DHRSAGCSKQLSQSPCPIALCRPPRSRPAWPRPEATDQSSPPPPRSLLSTFHGVHRSVPIASWTDGGLGTPPYRCRCGPAPLSFHRTSARPFQLCDLRSRKTSRLIIAPDRPVNVHVR